MVSNENIHPLQIFLQGLLKNYGSDGGNFTTDDFKKVMAGTWATWWIWNI